MAHIIPWSKVREHAFENMIVLCSVDHFRFDQGEIPKESIYTYKQNLAVINGRYNDFERRMLERFHESGIDSTIELDYSANTELSVRNLVRDGVVSVFTPAQHQVVTSMPGHTTIFALGNNQAAPGGAQRRGGFDAYSLTESGKRLICRWFDAELIDDDDDRPEVVVLTADQVKPQTWRR